MALTGLQIFKLMPKTNCKECGHPTCLAFSMALAASKIALDACPYVSDEAKDSLGAASAPPVAKIIIGKDEKARELGDETVLFRHDKRFYHPSCLAVTISDDLSDDDFDKKLTMINDLKLNVLAKKFALMQLLYKITATRLTHLLQKQKLLLKKEILCQFLCRHQLMRLQKLLLFLPRNVLLFAQLPLTIGKHLPI
jgi:CO dehydrogenase/acetyl-CoA synthase gamma subunit (corrinoid Fe-S protein)